MRIVVIILVLLFIVILLSLSEKKLSKKAKISIILGILFVGGFAYFYEKSSMKQSKKIKNITDSFIQGKTLTCQGADVNLSNFDFSTTTDSFTAKRNASLNFKNQIFRAEDCKVKE